MCSLDEPVDGLATAGQAKRANSLDGASARDVPVMRCLREGQKRVICEAAESFF